MLHPTITRVVLKRTAGEARSLPECRRFRVPGVVTGGSQPYQQARVHY
ncbi:hypothetical protein [Coleofasciculus sp. F4-SAH-05]